MLLNSELIKINQRGQNQLWCVFECDQYHAVFEKRRRGINIKKRTESSKDFCGISCRKFARSREGVSSDWVDKLQKTWKEKTGYSHPFKSDSVLQKRIKTWESKYGVDHPWKSKEIRTLIETTWKEKYGVDNPAKSHEVMSKIDQDAFHKKGHETRKRLGSYGKSKIEDLFYKQLCELYGDNNVERQTLINGWSIDFLVDNTVYVQFDGEHWHGLDRDIDVIRRSNKPVDVVIAKTYERDNQQNSWFEVNQIPLVRITDTIFKKFLKSQRQNIHE